MPQPVFEMAVIAENAGPPTSVVSRTSFGHPDEADEVDRPHPASASVSTTNFGHPELLEEVVSPHPVSCATSTPSASSPGSPVGSGKRFSPHVNATDSA